jgi:beta-N-acetylhexosaminidase
VGDTSTCSAVVFATFTTNPKLNGDLGPLLQQLTEEKAPVVLVSFGNPYLAMDFPKLSGYLTAFSTAIPSEVSMAKALVGAMPVTGRLPVTIPGFGQYGDGLQLAAGR